MKIILSRKGVDSSAGGFASPVFPDGQMISIPIPDKRSNVRYRDLIAADNNRSVGKLVRDLSNSKLNTAAKVHVDPDLNRDSLDRDSNWQPLFGQCGAAQTHLHSLNVGHGDLFLFFGWFRRVEWHKRRWRYMTGAPDEHVLFGWLQIDSVEPVENIMQSEELTWMRYHPHCLADFAGSNVIYTASKHLSWSRKKLPGAGLFKCYRDELRLTQPGATRSHWQLPRWMHPQDRHTSLSYHADIKRWQRTDKFALLRSAARGQEFVLDLADYPEGVKWVRSLLARNIAL